MKKLKILVLEDVKYDYELIVQELENLGREHETLITSNEDSFKKAIKKFRPDLILSDYNLPQFDGMSALLHTLKVSPKTPFIIVTGSINEEIAVDCIKAGAADYVTKEHLSRLTYAIHGALKQKQIFEEKEIAQAKLVESEERYRRLFEDSIDPILIINNYKFVDCNDAALRFLGYTNKTDFFKTPPYELSPKFQPDGKLSKGKDMEMMDNALKNGNYNFEWIHLTKEGKEVWVDVSLTHIPTLGKKGLYTIWRNITDRKTAELTQKVLFDISETSEATDSIESLSQKIHGHLGKIVDNSNFYIALYNKENDTYKFPFFKDKYEIISSDEEFSLKNSITDYVRIEGKSIRITAEVEEVLNKEKKIKSLGKPSPVWIGAPLIDSSTNSIIGVVAAQNYEDENALTDKDVDLLAFVARNIGTAIVRKRTNLAITESEEQFRSLAQTATDAIAIIDHESKIIFWNRAASKIFQFTEKEVIGEKLHNLIIPEKYLYDAGKSFDYFYKTGEGNILGKTVEFEGKRKDGSVFPVELSVSKFLKNGKWHATGFIRDITNRKQNEEDLKKARDKAEESDRLKTAFLANMSHEIRTPMNAILGFSELLSMSDLSDEERSEFVKLIQNNSNALLNLINDIIDIAKIEAEQLHINTSEFSVNGLLDNILKTYTEIKNNQNKEDIELNLEIPEELSEFNIISDQNRINQVISNLVGNSIKYTEDGIINFGCSVVTENNNEFVEFYVSDSGIGIPNSKINVIFERFRQGDDSYTREYGGTGLGLAISKNIAKLLGGDISVDSKEGEGSTFRFRVPLIQSKKETKVKTTKSKSKGNLDLSQKTILIVEDVESNYQLLETYLSITNAEIIWAKNGQEAVDLCKTDKHIDLILMDMQMPVLNGYEATKQIREIYPDIPIIAETAFALAGDREKILNAGCNDYLSKPIRANLLFEKIDKLI